MLKHLTTTGDNSNTLFSDRYQQTYHSKFGAVTESLHVFIDGAGVAGRLKQGQATRVLEIGLGLGLNCLLSADCATRFQTPLHYTAIEHDPISESQFEALSYKDLLEDTCLVDDLALALKALENDAKQIYPSTIQQPLSEYTSLTLYKQDATSESLLNQLCTEQAFDAIYLDAFSPDSNPECWTLPFFRHLHSLLAADGTLATYCVKGVVRRNLEAAGFKVKKVPGPVGKREVLTASRD